MPRNAPRLSARAPVRIPGARRPAIATGGRVNPASITGRSPSRRQASAQRAATNHALAEEAERRAYHALCDAWRLAPKGAAKRDALIALRAHEDRTGRMPYMGKLHYAQTVEVSTGAESWLEVK